MIDKVDPIISIRTLLNANIRLFSVLTIPYLIVRVILLICGF